MLPPVTFEAMQLYIVLVHCIGTKLLELNNIFTLSCTDITPPLQVLVASDSEVTLHGENGTITSLNSRQPLTISTVDRRLFYYNQTSQSLDQAFLGSKNSNVSIYK